MYTTDYVHLLCMKICPLYERFVNKEDQDENEKTPSKSNFLNIPKKNSWNEMNQFDGDYSYFFPYYSEIWRIFFPNLGHCKEKPNCEGKVVFDGESSQRSSKGNLDV